MTTNPKIGPHEEIELELMRVNQKIALFDFSRRIQRTL